VQGLLGPESVVTAVAGGGRSADDQIRFVPWGDEREPARPTAAPLHPVPMKVVALDDPEPEERSLAPDKRPPWPGRLPAPAPALVLTHPEPAVVLDAAGEPVGVSARLELTGNPAVLLLDGPVEIVGWAGPWPVDERWWAPGESRRRARFQIAVADGRAFLMSLAAGHWVIEAIYD